MLGEIVHAIDDYCYYFTDFVLIMIVYSALFEWRFFKKHKIYQILAILGISLVFRYITVFLSDCFEGTNGTVRRLDDIFPIGEFSFIRQLVLLFYAVFIGELLTKGRIYYYVILAVFYIPVSDMLHIISYYLSRLWPEQWLPGLQMKYILRSFTTFAFLCLLALLITRISRLLIKSQKRSIIWSTFIAAFLLNMITLYIKSTFESISMINWAYIMIVIIIMLSFLLMSELAHNTEYQRKLQFQSEMEQSYQNHILELENLSRNLRVFQHEYQNKLLFLESLLKEKKYPELEDTIHQMIKVIPSGEQLVNTENFDFDVIVNRKLTEIKANNIEIQVQIRIPKEFPFLRDDLFSLINNMMDNAMEAAKKTEQPWIHFQAKSLKNYLVLNLQNSCVGDVLSENPSLRTDKKNPALHGVGIQIMRSIVEKYNGVLDFSSEPGSFQCKVMLELRSF